MEYNSGSRNGFYWLETHQIGLGQLIKKVPELFLNKFLVSLYFDGAPAEFESANAIDSKMLETLSTDNHDQWILMNEKSQVRNATDYVNFIYFSLVDWGIEINTLQDEEGREFIELYWSQREKLKEQFLKGMEEINPSNFISDGSMLIFVTKDKAEVEKIINTFANPVQL